MFGVMLKKLISKWWLSLSLLLGCVLIIATAASFPLYQNAAYDRMLRDDFQEYLANEGTWPAKTRCSLVSQKAKEGADIRNMEEVLDQLNSGLKVTVRENIHYYLITDRSGRSTMNRSDAGNVSLRVGMLTGLADHAAMLTGEMYSESGYSQDGSIEVVVSQTGFVGLQLLVGETFLVNGLTDEDGEPFRFLIKGVFEEQDEKEPFWQVKADNMRNVLLMNPELFRKLFLGDRAKLNTFVCFLYSLFEYEDIMADSAQEMLTTALSFTEGRTDGLIVNGNSYIRILENYVAGKDRIRTTLTILQIPVLIMLAAFLFMISGQMYDMEQNEISVLKSRGGSGWQIFRLYLYQSLFLTVLGGALGIYLGKVFSRILGSARNFLDFNGESLLEPEFTKEVWVYTGLAMFLTLLTMTIPAIRYSKTTIVKLKQKKAAKTRKKSWWQKLFLDFILLGVSLYGYYTFRKNTDAMTMEVLKGETLDPLLYVSSSLFILGMGLFFLRIQPYLVQLIYLAGKRFWKPASYVSFRENEKNGKKQQFIMLFLIMTISLGMYHAVVARTIVKNATDNTEYLDNADVILKEVWEEITDEEGVPTGNYIEPDYERYLNMEGTERCTRVLYDDQIVVGRGRNRHTVALMGINTKEFGEITWVDKEYNGKHYYQMLNELAENPDGVLLSENFSGLFGYEVGDSFYYTSTSGQGRSAKIVGFFTYWPGYRESTTVTYEDGTIADVDNYLIVTHYDLLQQKWGTQNYEIWMDLKEGFGPEEMYRFIDENGIRLRKYINKQADLDKTLRNPLLQGTNGVLTMGFIVTLLLCVVGYLIYWIMSIRSREMIFGVLRACGMHKRELFHILMNEQIFSGLFPVLAGIGIGKLTSRMFVPMLQSAYAARDQVLPMKLAVESTDMMSLYTVIAGVMVLCLMILILILTKLNVAKALKLGEE